jgi:Fur family transcriptional regulator, ferric uptake regulator
MIASTQTNHPLPMTPPRKPSVGVPSLEDLLRAVSAAGLRITQPRIAILRTLRKQDAPISIDRLHRELKKSGCDLVTVYRCLDVFEEIGLVRHCYFHNGAALYELARADRPGYYVISRDTGSVRALDDDLAGRLQDTLQEIEQALQSRGYRGVRPLVEFVAQTDQVVAREAMPPRLFA